MSFALTIALKDLRLLMRDAMGLFWVFAFPVAFALFFGGVTQASMDREHRKLPLAFVDEDGSLASGALASSLAVRSRLELRPLGAAEARRRVRLGELVAYLHVRKGYGAKAPSQRHLEVGIDPLRKADEALIQGELLRALVPRRAPEGDGDGDFAPAVQRMLFGGPAPPPVPRVTTTPVLPAERGPRSAFDLVFPMAMLWGLMGCAATFAISLVAERTHGTLLRLIVAPIPRAAVLAGKALACLAACLATGCFLAALGWGVFGVVPGSWPLLLLALSFTSLAFVGITVFLSTLGRTEQAVAGAGWSALIVFAMLGGAMVPLSILPRWLQLIGQVSPVRWGIVALEGALWRGFGLLEIAPACGVLFGFGLVGFSLGWWRLSREAA